MSEQEALALLALGSHPSDRATSRTVNKTLRSVMKSPDDPRHEALQTVLSMIREGRLPKALVQWLATMGIK